MAVAVTDFTMYKTCILKLNVLCGISNVLDAYRKKDGPTKYKRHFDPVEDGNEFNEMCPIVFSVEALAFSIAHLRKAEMRETRCETDVETLALQYYIAELEKENLVNNQPSFQDFKEALRTSEAWMGKEYDTLPPKERALALSIVHTVWRTVRFNDVSENEMAMFKTPIGLLENSILSEEESRVYIQRSLAQLAIAARCLRLQIDGTVQFGDKSNWPSIKMGAPVSGQKVAESQENAVQVYQKQSRLFTVSFTQPLNLEPYQFEDQSKMRLSKCDVKPEEMNKLMQDLSGESFLPGSVAN